MEPPPDKIRTAEEVANRAVALFAVVGLALGTEPSDITDWLSENELWSQLTPSELLIINTRQLSKQQTIDASWLSERLIILIWALGKIENLPAANEQCDTSLFQDVLPPFSKESVREFLSVARLRSDADLLREADRTLGLHWEARDSKVMGRSSAVPVDIEVIQERHHAINWIIGYDGLPWDEVTTDT